MKILQRLLIYFTLIMPVIGFSQSFNVETFGTVADGITDNCKAIQAAIDTCSKSGGGKVIVPAGVYLISTIYLKNNVNLYLEKGAKLIGAMAPEAYPNNNVAYKNYASHFQDGKSRPNKALLFAEGMYNISLTGNGSIDGSGDSKAFIFGDELDNNLRPYLILFIDCKKVLVQDVTLLNSAYWLQNYLGCDGLHIKGIKVFSHANHNVDGMDIDSRNVLIEDCEIDSDDDGICLKSHDRNRFCENVVVRNCTVRTNCNGIKFGTSSIGGFRNIDVSNCVVSKAPISPVWHWQEKRRAIELPITAISGIALETIDGGTIENVKIANIIIRDCQTPIFIMIGNRGRKQIQESTTSPVGSIKNIIIENITATSHSKMSSSITAFPGYYVEDIQLNNIYFNEMGGGTMEETKNVLKENPGAYPENHMYGDIYPSSGFFIRHAKNIIINNISFSVRNADARPAVFMEDVEAITINMMKTQNPLEPEYTVYIKNGKFIHFNHPVYRSWQPFVKIEGKGCEKIFISGLMNNKNVFIAGNEVNKNEISVSE